jgi:hypothetical protein
MALYNITRICDRVKIRKPARNERKNKTKIKIKIINFLIKKFSKNLKIFFFLKFKLF